MTQPDHIRSSIDGAREYLRRHPAEARYRDSSVAAVIAMPAAELGVTLRRIAVVVDAVRRAVPTTVEVEDLAGAR